MGVLEIGLILAFILLLLLGSGIWVAMSLLGVAWLGTALFTGAPPGMVMSTSIWGAIATWSLAALPLFIWMGEILFRTRLAEDLFNGLAPWMSRLPGRLMHVNVMACTVFAAVSGSSAATTATIGRLSIPELRKRGYPERMVLGSLAGSGTLGFLIPPSLILIVYGVMAEVSIARLFIAGILPGLMIAGLFMGFIAAWSLITRQQGEPEPPVALGEKLRRAGRLIPVVFLIFAVIGTIYVGVATPTEAAALGVAGSLTLAIAGRSLTWRSFADSLIGATRTTCMIAFIISGASFLTVTMAFTGIPRALATWIGTMDLSPSMLIIALVAFFVVVGMFLDGISIVVLTTSVILPMVLVAGIDPIWFGIFLVVVVEMSQVTPPVGFNLFVIQGLTGRNIFYIAGAALPFFFLLVLAILILMIVPEIATWLPARMTGR